MTVYDYLSMGNAFSNAQFTPPINMSNISMSNFDTRIPMTLKHCDIINGAYLRASVNHAIRMNDPALSNGWTLSNTEFYSTGLGFPGVYASILVSTPGNFPYIAYDLSNSTYSNAHMVCPPTVAGSTTGAGIGMWYSHAPIIGGSDGISFTIACAVPNTQSFLFHIKGFTSASVNKPDMVVVQAHQFWMYDMEYVVAGVFGTNFAITPNQRTVMSIVCSPSNIKTYQDGNLRSNIDVPNFTMSLKHYASVLTNAQISVIPNNSNMKFYEYMIHDYSLNNTQVASLHYAIPKLYKWT